MTWLLILTIVGGDTTATAPIGLMPTEAVCISVGQIMAASMETKVKGVAVIWTCARTEAT